MAGIWWVFEVIPIGVTAIAIGVIMSTRPSIVLPSSTGDCEISGVAPEVIVYACLVTAGMPFVLPIGAAPNAIAYDSKQFTTGEFFKHGIPMSIMLLVVLGVAMVTIWPMLGMPILIKP